MSYDCSRDEEVLRFMRDHYEGSGFEENLELGRILCERLTRRLRLGGGYKRVKVAEVSPGERVLIRGVVTRFNVSGRTRRGSVINNLWVADETGEIYVAYFGDSELDVREGDIVEVAGRGKEWRGKVEVTADSVKVLARFKGVVKAGAAGGDSGVASGSRGGDREAGGSSGGDGPANECLGKVLDAVREAGDMEVDAYLRAASRCGVGEDEALRHVVVKRDRYGREWVEVRG